MEDSAAGAESERLSRALIELETDGIAYGDLSLSVALHGKLAESERLDGDIRRIFAQHDAKVIREGYGQLSAWWARMPGQPPGRQLRKVFMSAGAAACLSPLFGTPRGTPRCDHLDAPCLTTLETRWRTAYHYDLSHPPPIPVRAVGPGHGSAVPCRGNVARRAVHLSPIAGPGVPGNL